MGVRVAWIEVDRAGDVPLGPSAWPAFRQRARRGSGTTRTVVAPAPRPLPASTGLRRDRLTVAEHADTVLLTGPAAALLLAGDHLTECGDLVAVDPGIHRFGGPVLLDEFHGPDGELHPGQRRDSTWKCGILAEDELFHRARWQRDAREHPRARPHKRQLPRRRTPTGR
jgi:hypothetical protein